MNIIMTGLIREDIEKTKGYAIITMLLLHLFCVPGGSLCKPIIWLSNTQPLIYYIGWISAICAPTFCICNGYAHYQQGKGNDNGLSSYKCLIRVTKFLITFWTACTFVAIVGFIMRSDTIPVSLVDYVANMFLISWSYTGIWWYAFVYVYFVIISKLVFKIVEKMPATLTILLITVQFLVVETIWKIIPVEVSGLWIVTRLYYILGARLFCYFAGMYLAKYNVVEKCATHFNKYGKWRNMILMIEIVFISICLIFIEKGILLIPFSVLVFIAFHCWEKSKYINCVFSFLGKHSTYIWLIHPIIYSGSIPFFRNLLSALRYPVLIFAALLIVCIGISVFLSKISKAIINHLLTKKMRA